MKFGFNSKDFDMLISKVKQLPEVAEEVINEYLHTEGALYVIEKIKEEMPLGINDNKRSKGQPRTHAKFSDSLEYVKNNLGFVIKTSRNPFFGYLYFPSFGEGTSKHNMKNEFFERGAEAAKEKMIEDLANKLSKKIKEEITNA